VDTCTDPNSVSNLDRLGVASPGGTLSAVDGMIWRVDAHTRSEKDVVADFNVSAIQHYTIEVCVEIIAHMDVATKLAAKRWFEMNLITNGTKSS